MSKSRLSVVLHGDGRRQPVAGFTVFEILIVVVVIAILAAIALPAYQDYTTRSRLAAGRADASAMKVQIGEYRQRVGRWPDGLRQLGYAADRHSDPQGIYTVSLQADGAFELLFFARRDTAELRMLFRPSLQGSEIAWECSSNAPARAAVADCLKPL